MEKTRKAVHRWGSRNRVTFASQKEHLVVLHPTDGEGQTVRLLGCQIDVKLNMVAAIDKLSAVLRPKIRAMLRMKGSYNLPDMVGQFKTHVWGFLEYHCGSVAHASDTSLAKLDRLHTSYCSALHLDEKTAFLDYNFPPPGLRRDIAMLGFLHKRVLGQCHPSLISFLPFEPTPSDWHNKQLKSHVEEQLRFRHLYQRSLWGKILIYNRLHQSIVDAPSVKLFQKQLTKMARASCQSGHTDWNLYFHSESEMWRIRCQSL